MIVASTSEASHNAYQHDLTHEAKGREEKGK